MKVIAYYALHYGKEWLKWSMRSVRGLVDDIIVVYTPLPSHGHGTNIPCPETEDQLRSIAGDFQTIWYRGSSYRWEGDHRDHAVQLCEDCGADIVVVVDHDEVWDSQSLAHAIHQAKNSKARNHRVTFQHFWRSVKWICHDAAMPVRLHNLHGEGDAYIGLNNPVNHFGYAQSSSLMAYKWLIHGHKPELRPNWHQQKFLNWQPGQGDVHPTNVDFWTPEPFDHTKLSHLINDHPYYEMDIIP